MNESSPNPFAAPQAQVSDIPQHEGVGELKLFSFEGRIGRMRYLAYCTAALLSYKLAVGVLVAGLGDSPVGLLVLISSLVVLGWFHVITGIKRCHDLGLSGWWWLSLLVPVIVLVWIFVPGSKQANRFGAPPPPNGLGVKVLGLILPVAFLAIVLAVAVPAYKGYSDRARAAQAQSR